MMQILHHFSRGPIMDHYALKLFLHLSESLHFGRTGRACHISPSALSRQIQRLESEVGQRLFDRDNRKVTLTSAGILLRDYAREVLEKWRQLQESLAGGNDLLKGEISIYCSVTASLSILPDLLSRFKTAYPEVHIRLQTGDAGVAVRQVVEGDVDFAVAALPDRLPPALAFKVFTHVSLEFVAPKMAWTYDTTEVAKIPWDKIPMILSQRGLARQRVDAWFKQRRITPNIYALVSGNEAILSMVALGCGVGIVPGLVIENSPIRNRISPLTVTPPPAPYPVGMCVQKRRLSSRLIGAFWEIGEESIGV
jgi:LysR family positive regulator for ilvC